MLGAQTFYDWPPLLELSKRGCMEPDVTLAAVNLVTEYAERLTSAPPHLPRLGIEQRGDGHAERIKTYYEFVHFNNEDLFN